MGDNLFVYGSLMDPAVFHRVTGTHQRRREPAVLRGHRVVAMDHGYPAVFPSEADAVEGVLLYGLTPFEFAKLDDYEGAGYRRVAAVAETGGGRVPAHVYVGAE